jgi:cytoskeletal protein RodZ
MNHTIKGIIVVAAITSMLVLGLSMAPVMQNSFAQRTKPTDDGLIIKSADERQAEGNTNTNTNTNSATSDSDSTATASNTNNITNSATASNSQSQDACAVAVTCPEGVTTANVTLGLGEIIRGG